MIILKQILSQICLGDWFMSLDLKDAYFHIQVAPHHRRVLRFAFKGVDYQYKILPFGLSLAPRTFTRCMDAALSPLRQMGIRILNYLNDWLILAQLLAGFDITQGPPPQPLMALFHCMVRYGLARLVTVRHGSVPVGLRFHGSLVPL